MRIHTPVWNALAVLLLLGSQVAAAQGLPPEAYSYEPPSFCHWGYVDDSNYGVLPDEAHDPGGIGVVISYENGDWEYDLDLDWDFLLTRAPTHMAIGREVRVKGDGAFWGSYDDTVYFYDSLTGFNGSDNANLEGNAYLTYTVQENTRTDSQIGWVWTMKKLNGTPPWCSMQQVYFQHPPTVSTTIDSTIQGDRIDGVIYLSGYQDPAYSKNAVDLLPIEYEVQRKIISRWTGQFCDVVEESEDWIVARQPDPTTSFSFNNLDCEVMYRSRSFDGYYFSLWKYDMASNPHSSGSGGGSGGGGGGGGGSSCRRPPCDIEN